VAEIDNSTWDAGRALRECETAADYAKVCALDRGAGISAPSERFGLPHHFLSEAPVPNANGVRAAAAALGGARTGSAMTGAGVAEARAHIERHMRQINPDRQTSSLVIRDDGKLLARGPLETFAHSGRPDELFTIRGYVAVYGVPSHDMGGFRTVIAPGAFDNVLASSPDVHFVWDHDTRYPLARTKNGTLTLHSDATGLYMDARVGQYSYAKDLRTALERGDIDQGSVALTVAEDGDEWSVDDDEQVFRTIRTTDGLYDATVTAQGAFPQTSLEAAVSLMKKAASAGRLPEAGAALVAERGEQPSHKGGEESEVVRRAEELRNLRAVQRDELAKLQERMDSLR
jgi:HK97 family phage prohead protease